MLVIYRDGFSALRAGCSVCPSKSCRQGFASDARDTRLKEEMMRLNIARMATRQHGPSGGTTMPRPAQQHPLKEKKWTRVSAHGFGIGARFFFTRMMNVSLTSCMLYKSCKGPLRVEQQDITGQVRVVEANEIWSMRAHWYCISVVAVSGVLGLNRERFGGVQTSRYKRSGLVPN